MLIVVEQTCALPLNRNAEERINHIADDSEKKKKRSICFIESTMSGPQEEVEVPLRTPFYNCCCFMCMCVPLLFVFLSPVRINSYPSAVE